jgi:transcriptional regulator with XRE-family HTH domain
MTPTIYKELRQQIGKQREVAEMLGLTRQVISLREHGGTPIKKEAEIAIRFLASCR